MKIILSFLLSFCSVIGFSQTILYQAESTSRTVQDPQAVVLTQGFRASSGTVNPFVAKIGPSSENSGGGPADSNAGANNPSGTTAPQGKSFHDTKGNIEVNGAGQLQFTLPIALPPGVKSVAPQINLVYSSGSGNGIAGYGWNLSGITAISRTGKNIEKDGEIKGIQLDYSDYYSFNGQRLILKSGEYGKDGAEYVTEKYSNVKIKSVGEYPVNGQFAGPAHFEVTFEDGSQAWYGAYVAGTTKPQNTTPLEYNIVKWKDPQGNYITYNYESNASLGGFRALNLVMRISSIAWGGNQTLNKPHFNSIEFTYIDRDLKEQSYVQGMEFTQDKILTEIKVNSNGNQFKKYTINYIKDANNTQYQFANKITEYNSNGDAATPINIEYETSARATDWSGSKSYSLETGLLGDFDGDGKIDALEFHDQQFKVCESLTSGFNNCVNPTYKPAGLYLVSKALDEVQGVLTYIGPLNVTKEEFKKAIAISFKNPSGIVENKQGFALYKLVNNPTDNKKDIHLFVYSINESNQLVHQYTKILPNADYDFTTPEINPLEGGYSVKTTPLKLTEMDLDADGISELLIGLNDDEHTKIQILQNPNDPISIPQFEETFSTRKRYIIINMDTQVPPAQSYSNVSFYPYDIDVLSVYKIGDFDGDGKTDFLRFDSGNRPFIMQFKKGVDNLYSVIEKAFYLDNNIIKGVSKHAVVGDFNGDGKSDLLVPSSALTIDWYLYQSTGKSFVEEIKPSFALFRQEPEFVANDDGTATFERTSHQAYDLDRDGKSDFVTFNYRKERLRFTYITGTPYFKINYSNKIGIKISSGGKKFNNDISYSFNEGPIQDTSNGGFINAPASSLFSQRTGYDFQELLGNFKINQSVHQIVLIAPQIGRDVAGDRLKKIDFYDISKEARINAITQGGIKTDVEYKELDPTVDPNFYKPVKKEQYPYIELNKVYQSFAVSQLKNSGRKQDFRYRGFVSNFIGRGMIGFRQTARSSWYADGFENTKTWSGAEIDPLNNGVPVKEWSIRTNNENLVFPTDISENNTQLLSFSSTKYQTDERLNDQIVSNISAADRPKIVKAIIPTSTKNKDFLTGVVVEGSIIYGDYYLPAQSISNFNNGYGIKTSNFEYIHNPSGSGSDYYIGRPKTKTDKVQAYGDSKSSKEEYIYENNLLKTLKTWNKDNSGYLLETYLYDGFGNITQKVIRNSIDSQEQTSGVTYEPKGRFIEKETNNLGLETHFIYNDWGQIEKRTDPSGNTLINTYDKWGKLLTSKSNLTGTATYTYEKDNNTNTIITEYSADGDISKKYTNKLGQNYKVSTKAFGQGQFVSQETQYDILGRKLKESEPYFEGQSANQWNIMAYDDAVFPSKVTATSFTGKQLETSVSGSTSTVKELNGYNRTNSKTTDVLGNVISTTDKGGTIQFFYNASGQQIKAKYAENIVTTQYDNWGRKSEFNDPSNGLYKYEYDGFGQPKKITSPKGTKEYTYNNLGQLISHTEISTTDGGQATNKTISYTYDNKGRVVSKSGSSKGKSYSSSVIYDPQGRILSSSESSNGKYFIQKGVTYDDKARIISYEKQLYSSGILTKVQIENIYSAWNGELYQIKDKNSGKVLWEIQETNAKGQILKGKLGAAAINNTYDGNGFLTNTNHSSTVKPSVLQVSYSFDAIKNELKSRTTGGDFNIVESFDYDDNNRLVNWTNPVTGIKPTANRNVYDIKGRITQNDQVGTIKFENSTKIYQPTGMTLNAAGTQNYNNDMIQSIAYNENNDPVFIDGEKGDVAFQYGLTSMRQKVSYGGNFDPDQEGKFTKFYSEDGSFEVLKDNITGKEKHILYIGGTPYESNIVYLKNFTEDSGSYKFLHKDYLGSILAISDETGNKLEQRHFDAWGNFTHLQVGNGAVITDKNIINNTALLLERGYTSHEHFAEVGIIHMNGRLYDPLLRRFLNADENIQDPYNTQNYNKYGYVLNNPLIYNDPSGEVLPFLIGVGLGYFWATVISGAIIGAAISVGMYALQATLNNNWSWGGFAKSLLMGTVTGAVSAGLGEVFSAGGIWATVGNGALTGAGSGGAVSLINGDNFLNGVLKGAVIGGAIASISYTVNHFVKYAGMKDEFKYYDGESSGQNGETLEYSNKTLQTMRNDNFTPEETHRFRVDKDLIGSKKYSMTSDGFFQTTNGKAYAYTTPPNFLTGKSFIHYSRAAFASEELLFTTMVHETGHAYIMNAGNFFIKKYDKIKLFNRGYSSPINDLGHAAIYDGENYLSLKNSFKFNPAIGVDKDLITNAINNNASGNNIQGFNLLKKFLLPVFNRIMK